VLHVLPWVDMHFPCKPCQGQPQADGRKHGDNAAFTPTSGFERLFVACRRAALNPQSCKVPDTSFWNAIRWLWLPEQAPPQQPPSTGLAMAVLATRPASPQNGRIT